MKRVFADTYFFIAILNAHDMGHTRAIEFAAHNRVPLLTTAWVLTELADGLAASGQRHAFRRIVDMFEAGRANLIVPANIESFESGVDLYNARLDKQWSLTDCISFAVMLEEGITEALTGDRHFEQAGFTALLR